MFNRISVTRSASSRSPVGNATQGRWLTHPKTTSGIMIEGTEEWPEKGP